MASMQLTSFTPAPRKEGRYNPCLRQRSWRTTVRIIAGAITVFFCYVLFMSPSRQESQAVVQAASETSSGKPPNRTIFESQSPLEYEPNPPISSQELLHEASSSVDELANEPSPPVEILVDKSKKPETKPAQVDQDQYSDTAEEERDRMENSLAKVINMLPDEMHVRELLRPVEGTGKEKMREMGLRARAFKKFFEAWEALHLVPSGESYFVRDDIIQYLRSQHLFEDEASLAQTVRSYETFRSLLQNLATLLFPWTSPYFSDHMTLHTHFHRGGRGIVLTAGDDQAPYLLTTITHIRKRGCELPIEIMYLGDSDLGEDFRAELEALPDVITRDISQMVNDRGWQLKGWAGKPFAILLSSFREVIFIDADALFFVDPEVLFDDPGYQETGALFFHDRLMMAESKKRWLQQTLPKPISKQARQSRFWTGQSGHMQESGVVVVDKWKHFTALLLVTRLNGPDRDGNKEAGVVGVYDMVYGDKETFWIGWELVGDVDYAFHKGDTGIMGVIKTEGKEDDRTIDKAKPPKPAVIEQASGNTTLGDEDAAFSDGDSSQNALLTPHDENDVLFDDEIEDRNATICAPQVVHFTEDGRPLWFNGWIMDNKFDKKHAKAGQFEVYLREPREIQEPEAWKLGEHNMCCLTRSYRLVQVFDEDQSALLKDIVDIARDVGAYEKSR